ncbi:uncharacterized protein LOC118201275 [Stegodyphus dumicola]|uniref:uncharacterized protein LOC118201275 n=1 Tax=Stegodyphus dumicola TaxID=202533 RepID=UPI0015B27C68|nr:uncharacterized protein LOC118201275 [Stegodyphus dumicola]
MALGSPFFEKVFYHTPYVGPVPIPITDVTPEAFRCVMHYLYTDRVTFKGDYEAFATYVASHHFEMDSLKMECEDYISSLDIQPQNVWSRLENASRLLMAKIVRKCLTYIQRNTLRCLTNDAFMSAKPDSILRLLQMEILEVSEITLLEWLMCWAKRNIGTDHNLYLREFLAPCLIHIRFKAITAKEFCRFTKNYPQLLDENDVLKILQYLELPHANELPQWCCKLPKRKRC